MKIGSAFPSKYLKDTDIEGDVVFTMDRIEIETLGQGNDAEEKPVVYFRETEKGLVLNKTNAQTITTLYGDETDDWSGKRITLYATEVPFGPKMVMSIRVRLRAPTGPAKPAAVPTGPTAATQLVDVKRKIAAAAKQKWPTLDAQTMPSKIGELVADFFPGQIPSSLGVSQWQQMLDAGLEPALSEVAAVNASGSDGVPF